MGSKNLSDGATGPRKKFEDIFSGVDTMHERDRRTDARTENLKRTTKRQNTQITQNNTMQKGP